MASPKPNYPWFTHRFAHLGDSAPPALLPGGPTQVAGTRRRVYIGDTPARGYPPDPGVIPSDVYPADTTMIGRNEGATDDAVNRALWAVHEKVDSVGDRPALFFKNNFVIADTAPLYQLDLTDNAIWGAPTLNWAKLLFLGPVGSNPNMFAYYSAILDDHGYPLKNSAFEDVRVFQAWTTPLGLGGLFPAVPSSLFVGGALSISPGGYFPDGDLTGITGYGVVADVTNLQLDAGAPGHWAGLFGQLKLTGPTWPAPWTGGPTSDGAIVGYCLFNYSLAQRIPQYLRSYLWKAFATVIKQDPIIGPTVGVNIWVNHDILADPNPDYNWKNGDIVYRTTVALAPTISFKNLGVMNPHVFKQGSGLTGGSWNWLKTTDDSTMLQACTYLIQKKPDIKPCLELDLPSTVPIVGGHDGHFAFERLNADQVRGSVGYETIDVAEDITGTNPVQALPFANFRRKEFTGNTVLSLNQALNAYGIVAANRIQLALPPATFATVGSTQLMLWHDIVEVYDNAAADAEPVGLWVITGIPADNQADLVRVDGEDTGAGLPNPGYIKIIRPETSVFNKVWWLSGLPGIQVPVSFGTVRTLSPGSTFGGLVPLFSYISITDADADGAYAVFRWDPTGNLGIVYAMLGDGTVTAPPDGLKCWNGFRCPPTEDYKFDASKTFYHQISFPDGFPALMFSGVATSWKYYLQNPVPGNGDDVWVMDSDSPIAEDLLLFPVHLPDGAVVTGLDTQYEIPLVFVGNALVLLMKKKRSAAKWSPAAAPPPYHSASLVAQVTISTPNVVTGAGQFETYPVGFITPGEDVIDNELHEYYIVIRATGNGVALQCGKDVLHGLRIVYALPALRPA